MDKTSKSHIDSRALSDEYIKILEAELIPSLGCTEPIAIAYAAARAKTIFDSTNLDERPELPKKMIVSCSGNIIKNVKGVIVPNSGGLKGVEVSAVLGMLGGDSTLGLEVLTPVSDADRAKARELLADKDFCTVKLVENEENLYIKVELFGAVPSKSALVTLEGTHTNIIEEEKDGEVLLHRDSEDVGDGLRKDLLNFKDIYEFANSVDISRVRELLKRQIECNMAISKEGLAHEWGASVGRTTLEVYGDDVKTRIKALAAAGSDARMGGCLLPVVINSGSGNQGITVCIPVVEYAKELNSSEEEMLRALVFANLIGLYLKVGIGRLSAYCGAVSAAASAMAGVTYLKTHDYDKICKAITNALANDSGIVCDGAKASCAAKINTALDAAMLGHFMAMEDRVFPSGEGIVKDDIEATLKSISRIGKEGMKETDVEILRIMIEKE